MSPRPTGAAGAGWTEGSICLLLESQAVGDCREAALSRATYSLAWCRVQKWPDGTSARTALHPLAIRAVKLVCSSAGVDLRKVDGTPKMPNDEPDLIRSLLKQALVARLACNKLRLYVRRPGSKSNCRVMPDDPGADAHRLATIMPLPPQAENMDREWLQHNALDFLVDATRFMTSERDTISRTDVELHRHLC